MTLFGWAGLAGTTFAAALLQAVSGFGFAVLAVPLYLLLVDPAQAVQLAIILSTALSFAVVSGLRRTVAPALLLRLSAVSLAGLPIGLFAFRYADRLLVRLVVGATILAFAAMMAGFRIRGGRPWAPSARTQPGDLVAGAVAGVATALVGMAGPPVLIYLLLAGTAAQTVRATLLAFFCAVSWRNSCIPCRDDRHPWHHLGGCRHPCALRVARRSCREADRRPPRQRRLCHLGDRVARHRRALYGGRCGRRACHSPTMNIPTRPTGIDKS
jgi:uncharacterized membrane protein YfcA